MRRRCEFTLGLSRRFDLWLDQGGDIEVAGSQQWSVRRSDRQLVVLASGASPKRAIEPLLDGDVASAPGPSICSGGQGKRSARPADSRIGLDGSPIVEAEDSFGWNLR
jgi:hypothetical protein